MRHATDTHAALPAGKSLEAACAVQLEASLRPVGVDLQLKGLAPNVLFGIDGPGFRGHFDLALTPFFWLPDPDDSVVFACANVAPRGNNWSRNAYAHIERIVLDRIPEIITDWQVDAEPVSVDLRGFRDRATFARPYRWSI